MMKGVIMGMRISSGNTGMAQMGGVQNWQQKRQEFKKLETALQSGDLSSAQQAFATMTAKAGNATGAANANNPLAKVGLALQAGDLKGAQQAFAALRSSGHHHARGSASAQSTSATDTTASTQTLDQKFAGLLNSLSNSTGNTASAGNDPQQTLANILSSVKSGIGGSYTQAQASTSDLTGSLINMVA